MAAPDHQNLLEPYSLVEAFLAEPPANFSSTTIACADGLVPCFLTRVDLLTPVEPTLKRRLDWLAARLPRPRTLIIGSTSTEYFTFPRAAAPDEVVQAFLAAIAEHEVPLAIMRCLPDDSPLLTAAENASAQALRAAAAAAGLIILSGDVLAYVPIDFQSIDEFLNRFSHSRRKDFRRKLRSRATITIEELPTGSEAWGAAATVRQLYDLYLNVFDAGDTQLERLTLALFASLLRDSTSGGRVFLYRKGDLLIGFNLCYVYRNNLVDKFVGFKFPEARAADLYFVSWFHNLEYGLRHGLTHYVAGYYALDVKARLGASFTKTHYAVYIDSPVLRTLGRIFKRFFEGDAQWLKRLPERGAPSTSSG